MIILSLNLRGFGSPTKLASLKRLLQQIKPNIVLLQETLIEGDKAKNLFFQCLPHWNVGAIDSIGRSRGLLTSWNPSLAEFCAFGTVAGIFLEGRLNISKDPVKLLNCYAPYKDSEPFWKQLFDSRLLSEDNIIIGGDLKFILSSNEVWGELAQNEPLDDFLANILHVSGLVDLHPSVMSLIWWNGISGSTRISKRLDHFLLDSKLLGKQHIFCTWVVSSTISNHNLICLQFDGHACNVAPPLQI